MTTEVEPKWISGFWRRLGALLIDALVLGAVGFALGFVLENTFVEMGAWGRLVGFLIALVYFGVMNSSVIGGQTLGKMILKIRVVDSSNAPVGLGKSILRYIIIALPFSLNGAQFSNEAMSSFMMYPLSIIIFGGMFSIFYLYVFNRTTRQSLHDLVVGTFVVNVDSEKQDLGKVWNIHIIVFALLLLTAAIIPAFTSKLAQSEPFTDILAVQSALSSEPNVAYASVSVGTTTLSTFSKDASKNTSTKTYVNSQVFIGTDNVSDIVLARNLASIVLSHYPAALEKDAIQITLTYGYDIGIASSWSTQTHNFKSTEL